MEKKKKKNFAPKGVKSSRILASWLTDERPFVENHKSGNFKYIIVATDFEYIIVATEFIDKVGNWNKDIFGNIFNSKKELGGIQRTLEKRYSRRLLELEIKLKKDLVRILTQEEVLVGMIKNDLGQWIHHEADIKAHAVSYFCNLYTKKAGAHIHYPLINKCILNDLSRFVDDTETGDTRFSTGPMSSCYLFQT